LEGDPVRLHQIILNLLSNAVKFTKRGRIIVSVSMLEQDNEKVTIKFAIEDTGIGISEVNLGNIFDDFHQATSETSRLFGGTGLGLAIVKQLVESQGGSISVESEEGKGSIFSFILDFKKTKAKLEITEAPEITTGAKKGKVLVVEDIALNQLLMKTLLEEFGFELDVANNGKIAIEKLSHMNSFGEGNNYDIILMDLQMPEMNGFEATDYIRNKMKLDIPILALTADVTTVDLQKCKAVGMNDYISKPVDEKILYSKITQYLKNGHQKKIVEDDGKDILQSEKIVNLNSLKLRTKNNPKLMTEMISLYLKQTPSLTVTMKQSVQNNDWNGMQAAVHKMIPSFSIMGIHKNYEDIAIQLQEYSGTQMQPDKIESLVLQLERMCIQVTKELEEELNLINIGNHN